jgi:hypothetical protein
MPPSAWNRRCNLRAGRAASEISPGFWAVEVKNATRVRPEDLGGLKAFAADYPECEPLLLYRGPERLWVDRVRCLPVEGFLRALKPARPAINTG